ncbi:hypothetical protein Y1Q_0013269 [Alligator mississippiensis]|uniref:Uncharacterized protein n=1 Tax=Alligator mississippiensis TaxID=8496 RepID=A0A151MPA2_ALLMI|nr:hypothetical protein Y1Q_0013269 [Alligator mississippiensis]
MSSQHHLTVFGINLEVPRPGCSTPAGLASELCMEGFLPPCFVTQLLHAFQRYIGVFRYRASGYASPVGHSLSLEAWDRLPILHAL